MIGQDFCLKLIAHWLRTVDASLLLRIEWRPNPIKMTRFFICNEWLVGFVVESLLNRCYDLAGSC